ncbi:hypothetical protein M0R88_09915 [Halorussus gelatinilyticus]|uniref:Uncharacterized protein n=1 Tax=Halorussus gelatinilyticus TaxID=2937524 RepID=A0A8U0IFL7_9EURY|nr:DUF6735 family protein [Halorussus gelatinilyticus]UPV98848.1 hypothetical protein M0R88_09915 [Halorussus gelatinilyticus]
MGHRALLAYRRDNSTLTGDSTGEDDDTGRLPDDAAEAGDDTPTYDLHRSHWGGADFALLDRIRPDAPYATDTQFAVDPEPIATGLTLAEIAADHLNFLHHEAFYRVAADYETTAFHPVWFGLDIDSETVERSATVGHGALVEAVPEEANYFRGWVRGTKAVVGEMVDREALSREAARDYLVERVRSWADDRVVVVPS